MRWTPGHGFATVLALSLASSAGCKPKTSTTSPPASEPAPATGNEPPSTVPADAPTEGKPAASPTEAPKCAAQGEAWDGRPGTCLYEHHGCCYPDPASLCAAAGCSDDNCNIVESRPAQAACD